MAIQQVILLVMVIIGGTAALSSYVFRCKNLQAWNRPPVGRGSHFTSQAFTGLLAQNGIKISMYGKGSYNNDRLHQALDCKTPVEMYNPVPVEAGGKVMAESLLPNPLEATGLSLNLTPNLS